MQTPQFQYGLPTAAELNSYRIWDSYFTPAFSHPGKNNEKLIADIERSQRAIKLGHIEKLCYFTHVGLGTTTDAEFEKTLHKNPQQILEPLKKYSEQLLGMILLNPHHVKASLDAIERWIENGPMLGVYFSGGGPAAMTCTHSNFLPLIERIQKTKAVIMQHTWNITGRKQGGGISTSAELALLAKQFPEQRFICAHAGGEWEKGIRAVRESPNVLIETSGFDATAGFIELAVQELGADRIIFGSHLPSRSLGTELSKVTGANIKEEEKQLILGENYRNLLSQVKV